MESIHWKSFEEKHPHSKEREVVVLVIGVFSVILALLFKLIPLAMLFGIATATFIFSMRKEASESLFGLTDEGFMHDEELLPYKEITEFNVIDDPGDKARLFVRKAGTLNLVFVTVIYDTDIEKIQMMFRKNKVKENESLRLSFLDTVARFF